MRLQFLSSFPGGRIKKGYWDSAIVTAHQGALDRLRRACQYQLETSVQLFSAEAPKIRSETSKVSP